MYNQTFLDKIVSQSRLKINQIAFSNLDILFAICFVTAVATIVTGITVNLYCHNLFN